MLLKRIVERNIKKNGFSTPLMIIALILTGMFFVFLSEQLGIAQKEKNLTYRAIDPNFIIKHKTDALNVNQEKTMLDALKSIPNNQNIDKIIEKTKDEQISKIMDILIQSAILNEINDKQEIEMHDF